MSASNSVQQHCAHMASFYASLMSREKLNIQSKFLGMKYRQEAWKRYLRYEDRVLEYADKLMKSLEVENAVMLQLFREGALK